MNADSFFSKNDIPFEVGKRAHYSTSFYPERRGKQEQEEYYSTLKEIYNKLYKDAVEWNNVEKFEKLFEKFVAGYKKRYLDYLHSRSGLMSTMITGPSNFPVRSQRKKSDAVHNKLNELLRYSKEYPLKIRRWIMPPELKPVKTGRSESLGILQKKLKSREERQEFMKASNKIVRSKRLSSTQKENDLKELGHSDAEINGLLYVPDYAGKVGVGYYSYQLQNNNAEIRRLKQRIETEKKLAEKSKVGNKEYTFPGGNLVENFELNRIQLKHDEIPDKEIRQGLKKNGWRWSRHYGVWQRQLNTFNKYHLQKLYDILGIDKVDLKEVKKETPTPLLDDGVKLSSEEEKAIESKAKEMLKFDEKPKEANTVKEVKKSAPKCDRTMYISKISTDEARFQNRKKLNQDLVNEIANNFDINQFDPIVIWYDLKKKSWVVLAGHHRFEGAKKTGRKTIPVRCFDGTEAEAVKYAKELSNANRTLETPLERAKIYQKYRQAGTAEKKIIEKAKKLEGKNWNYIINLSYLSQKGKVINALKALESNTDKTTQQNLEKIADWTGEARRKFNQLTNVHENEIFDFLLDNFSKKASIKKKTDFITKVAAIVQAADFKKSDPLNLKRIKYTTQGESEYSRQMDDINTQIAEQEKEKKRLSDRFNNPNSEDYVNPTVGDYDQLQASADKIKKMIDQKLKVLRKKKLDLMQKKGTMIQGGLNQMDLFAPAVKKFEKDIKEIRKEQNKPSKNQNDIKRELMDIYNQADEKSFALFVRKILNSAYNDRLKLSEAQVINLAVTIRPIIQSYPGAVMDIMSTNKRVLAPTFNNFLRWANNPGRYDLVGVDIAQGVPPNVLAKKVKKSRILNLLGIK